MKLDKSKFIFGDGESTLQKLPDKSIDLILTDPPYAISRSDSDFTGGSWRDTNSKYYTTPPTLYFGDWDIELNNLDELFKQYYRILRPRGTIIFFYDIWKMNDIKKASSKFKQHRICIWQKTNPVPLNSKLNYLSNTREYFCTMVKGSNPTFKSEYNIGVYNYPILHGKERLGHPTQKPLQLFMDLINIHSNDSDTVLDNFAGTCTTAEACLRTHRKFICIEKDAHWYQVGCDRIKHIVSNKLITLEDIEYINQSDL